MRPQLQNVVFGMLILIRITAARAADGAPAKTLFSTAPLGLRSVEANQTGRAPVSASQKPVEFKAESSGADSETGLESTVQRYEAMNGGPLVMRNAPRPELGGVAGFLQTKVFEPIGTLETVKFHRVYLTGGVVGAVKKRNPFYLLNPLVFSMDW